VRLVVLGPPGVGKGSLAALCAARLGLAHLSPGAIFRQEMGRGTALGGRVRRYVSAGLLVPDRLVVEVMGQRLRRLARARGFVLDGFPRTAGQAGGLDRVLAQLAQPLDAAVHLQAPVPLLVRRLSGRRVCPRCGTNYHLRTMRPRRPGRCDRCGARLVRRPDDEPGTIRRRLAVDRRASAALLRHYRGQGLLYPLDGRGRIETVYGRAARLFRRAGWLA
jgi:adenylate kinase